MACVHSIDTEPFMMALHPQLGCMGTHGDGRGGGPYAHGGGGSLASDMGLAGGCRTHRAGLVGYCARGGGGGWGGGRGRAGGCVQMRGLALYFK